MEIAIGEVLISDLRKDWISGLVSAKNSSPQQVATFPPEDSQKASVKYSMTSAKSFLIK